MSDFDKEAERERLREQYERDQRKREATEKMSDLLLKGATMTNSHCSECGDPIFRYDGREFCPTCQRIVEDDVGSDAETDAETDAGSDVEEGAAETDADDETPADASRSDPTNGTGDDEDPEHIEVKRPTGPAAAPAGAVDESATDDTPEATPEGQPTASTGSSTADDTTAPEGAARPPADRAGTAPASATGHATAPIDGGETSLSAARESLVRTLTVQARRAEACEDPRQVRDHLEAAREAAETLAALSS